MKRVPEPEVMDDLAEVRAYAQADFRDVNRRFARRAAALARKRSGHALDLGTGPAEIPILLCRLCPGWRVTAVDMSRNMLEAARANVARSGLAGRIVLHRGDVKELSGLSGRFDLVLSNSLLHHLDDPLPFWMQVRLLAAPAGAVLVQDLLRPASRREARGLVRLHAASETPLLKQLFYQSLLAAFTVDEVRAQLAAAGLNALAARRTSDRHLTVRGRV